MNGMKRLKVWKVTALFAALLMLPLFSPAAQADGLSLGAIFRIGGVHFNLTFGDFGYGHPRGYYYRTADPISYGGYRCNSYCFNSGGYHYHHESCPLVRHHLAYFDIDPLGLFDRYAPGYGNRYNSGYGYGYGYGDRYNSYDNRYDYRYDNRYNYRHDGYTRRDGYNRQDRYDNYPYRDRRQGYDRNRDHGRHDRDRDRRDGRHDRNDRNDGRNDRNDGRHDRQDGGHHGGHSSDRPRQHH